MQVSVTASSSMMFSISGKFLDAFAEGLEFFRLRTAINTFPELSQELFVPSDACTPSDVHAILHFDEDFGTRRAVSIANYMKNAIQQLNETGT